MSELLYLQICSIIFVVLCGNQKSDDCINFTMKRRVTCSVIVHCYKRYFIVSESSFLRPEKKEEKVFVLLRTKKYKSFTYTNLVRNENIFSASVVRRYTVKVQYFEKLSKKFSFCCCWFFI